MNRTFILAVGMVLVFAVTVGIMLNVVPGPHKSTDYLVMGAVATMLCLLLLFVILFKRADKRANTKKPDAET